MKLVSLILLSYSALLTGYFYHFHKVARNAVLLAYNIGQEEIIEKSLGHVAENTIPAEEWKLRVLR